MNVGPLFFFIDQGEKKFFVKSRQYGYIYFLLLSKQNFKLRGFELIILKFE